MTDDTTQTPPSRRTVLRAAAVGGGLVWATPVVQAVTLPAHAQGAGTPPPGEIGLSFVILLLKRGSTYYRVKFEVDGNQVEIGPNINAPKCSAFPAAPHASTTASGTRLSDVVVNHQFVAGGLTVQLTQGTTLLDYAVKQGQCCLTQAQSSGSGYVVVRSGQGDRTYTFPSAKDACARQESARTSLSGTTEQQDTAPDPQPSRKAPAGPAKAEEPASGTVKTRG